MSQKFIDWENLAYVLEQLRKETIDHASLDEHLDAMWETREKVTNKMKYGADINPLTEQTYTLDDYNNDDITPHKSIVGINQHNLTQDGRLDDVESKNEEQDGRLDTHDATLETHAGSLSAYGIRLNTHDTTLGSHTSALSTYRSELNAHDTTLRTHTNALSAYGSALNDVKSKNKEQDGRLDTHDTTLEKHAITLSDHGKRITSVEGLLEELMATNLLPLATDADTEGMLNDIFGGDSIDSNDSNS